MNIPSISTSAISARKAVSYFCLSALFAVAAASAQVGVVGDTGIDTSGNFQQERGWCMVNTTGEARVACLKNSGAALSEKRRGTLDNNGADFGANAMRRCDVFTGDDREACKARVMGSGSTSGSVQDGGTMKQVERVVAPKTP